MIAEFEATELTDNNENVHALEGEEEKVNGELDIDDTKTNKIYLMDFSSDRKWISYVSQCEAEPNKLTTYLSLRKFTAINDESLRVEIPATVFHEDTSIVHEMRIQIDANPLPQLKSMPIDKYFNSPGHKFLSISPNGQYISLSTYDENKGNKDGLCFIFKVQKNEILFHQKLQWNGRAVFLNSNDGICLAIINTAILIVYDKVEDFSKVGKYEVYDLTSFGSSREDFKGSSQQYLYTEFTNNWSVTNNPLNGLREMIPSLRHIIALSAYIEYHVLITPFAGRGDVIRIWSLLNNGLRLATLPNSKEVIIAISNDFRYAATVNNSLTKYNIVKVYSLENGCHIHTLKSEVARFNLTHAIFCYDARFLALSGFKSIYGRREGLIDNKAIFEVWCIDEDQLVQSATRSLGNKMRTLRGLTQEKSVKPFMTQEMVGYNERVLKGYYVYGDVEGKTITRCFKLNFGGQQLEENTWLLPEKIIPRHLRSESEYNCFSDYAPLADCLCFDGTTEDSDDDGDSGLFTGKQVLVKQ